MKKADKLFKQLINENYIDLKPITPIEATPKTDFENKFAEYLAEEAKIVEKKPSKEVEEIESHNYDYKDPKNLDNQIGQEVLNGIYFEAKQNPDKTLDEIREIVSKNLAKDGQYYMNNAMFGIDGLKAETMKNEEVSGKHAASGYSDKVKEVVKESLMSDVAEGYGAREYEQGKEAGEKIEKKKLSKKAKKESIDTDLAEIDKQAQIVALEAKLNKMDEVIEGKMTRINMVSEDENLAELMDKKKLKAMQKEVKILEKRKAKMEKMYEKMCGKKYQREEIVDEVEEINESPAANLELKSAARKLYQAFDKLGANVELVTDKATLNKAKTGNLDEKDVWIAYVDDGVSITLVGDKAMEFEDKIKSHPLYSQFSFPETGFEDGETWGGRKTRTVTMKPGATTSE